MQNWLPGVLIWLVFAGFAVYVSLAPRRRVKAVQAYVFPLNVRAALARERPDLSDAQRDEAWAALREYFLLHAFNPKRSLAMPSVAADAAWHCFILSTQDYARFCEKAFGRYLHHTPNADAQPARLDGATDFHQSVVDTWHAHKTLRRRYPGLGLSAPPLLFALDAAIGAGWIYTDAAMAKLEAMKPTPAATGDSGSSCGGSTDSSPSGDGGGHSSGHSCGGHSCGSSCGGSSCSGGGH